MNSISGVYNHRNSLAVPLSRSRMVSRSFLITAVLCSAISDALATHVPSSWAQRNYETVRNIYNMTIFPHNQAFITRGIEAVPAGLFATNASGRITPVGNFTGFEDSVEYFFGLTPIPQAPLFDTWTNARIVSFSSECPQVASSVVYGDVSGVSPNATTYGKKITTIKQIAFWRFDDTGAVVAYDAWLPNLQRYSQLQFGTPPTSQFQDAEIEQICVSQNSLCTGSNTQYNSTADCIKHLKAKKFGNFDELWGDNVVCRSLHVLLAKLRPDVSGILSLFA